MDDFNAALVAAIKATGGSAFYGPKLFPEKTPESAQRMLLDCLNDDRPAKLSPDQLLLILRWARKKGNHSAFEFMAQDLGYTRPTPIEPKDEMAELQRQFIAAVEKQAQASETAKAMLDRLEQLQQRPQLRSAA